MFVGGYCLIAGGQGRNKHAKRAVRQVSLLTAGVYFMSPLLQTLTKSVSRSAPLDCLDKSITIAEHPVHCSNVALLQQFSNAKYCVCSDSIVVLVCGLLVMHLYLHDYNFVDQLTDTLTGSMSLTAATFASTLVASQLRTQLQVFAQVSTFHAIHSGSDGFTTASNNCLALLLMLHACNFCTVVNNNAPLCRCCSLWSFIYCSLMCGVISECGQQQPTKS